MCAVIGRRRDRLVLQLACGSASPLTCTGTGLGRAVVSGPEAGGATGLASAGTGRLRRRALSPTMRGVARGYGSVERVVLRAVAPVGTLMSAASSAVHNGGVSRVRSR
jgi:hypothetical protein